MAKIFTGKVYMGGNMARKFTDDEVLTILQRHEDGATITQLALEYGVGYHSIYRIVMGESYKHLQPGSGVSKTKANYHDVVALIEDNYSVTATAKALGVSDTTVSKIYKKMRGQTVRDFRRKNAVRYGEEAKLNG